MRGELERGQPLKTRAKNEVHLSVKVDGRSVKLRLPVLSPNVVNRETNAASRLGNLQQQ